MPDEDPPDKATEEATPAAPSQPPAPSPRVPLAVAAVAAWVVIAIVNAVFIARLPGKYSTVRGLHHLIDAAHLIFLGALISLGVALSARFGPRRPRAGLLAIAAAGVGIAFGTVWNDVAGFASEAAGETGGVALSALMVTVVGLSPAVVALVGSLVARRGRLWLPLLFLPAVGVAIANDLVLPADYRGLHLFAAIDAAVALTVALSRLPLPRRLAGRSRAGWVALAAVLLPSAVSVAMPPSNKLRVELGRIDGAVLVPVLARLGWGLRRGQANVPRELAAWLEDRHRMSPVAPSRPTLLPKDPIVILVGVDSMRADLFTRPETRKKLPRFMELQKRSVDFTVARSPGARTITTWSQIFTGRYVSALRWDGDGNRLSIRKDPTRRVTELLGAGGVETASFVSYSALGKKGLSRNVDTVIDVPNREGQKFGLSADVVPLMLAHLDGPRKKGPQFLFAHWMDPHYPYDAGKTKKGKAFDRFLSEVELADASLGALWDGLEERALLDRVMLVVTADHGEGLGEHGTPYHTVNLYEEAIRVPLFVRIPGVAPRKVDEPVTLIDLGPTFMDLLDVPTPASFMGQSLVPFLRGESPRLTRPIAAERSGTRTMVFGDRKVIVDREHGRAEIYDLAADPEEANNLADSMGNEGDDLAELVRLFFDTHSIPK